MHHLASGPGKVTYIQTRLGVSRQWKGERDFHLATNNQLQHHLEATRKNILDGVRKIEAISSATGGTCDKLTAIIEQFQLRLDKCDKLEREKKILQEEHQKLNEKYQHYKNKRKAAEAEEEAKKIDTSPPAKKATRADAKKVLEESPKGPEPYRPGVEKYREVFTKTPTADPPKGEKPLARKEPLPLICTIVDRVELPSKAPPAKKEAVKDDLFAQLSNLDPGILKSLLTRHVEEAKTSTEKSKDYTEDEGVDILTQIGVSQEDIEIV